MLKISEPSARGQVHRTRKKLTMSRINPEE
ncbi:MAG: hypothetical protein DRI46_09335 [Chloroflexi bacterium]|nr:MAG: hypothetical protein DRI46_09335 [Chloroflexota bacterium]